MNILTDIPVQLYVGVDGEVGLAEGELVRGDVPLLETGLGGQAGKVIVGILVLAIISHSPGQTNTHILTLCLLLEVSSPS